MDLTEDGDQDKPKEVIRKKRKTGSRCIAYGCDNTLYKGFIMHLMPGKMPVGQEHFDNVQKQWITFIGKKRKFEAKDANTYSKIFVCSGHFVREDYEQSQVEMYRRGLRTRPPSLKKCSLPSLNTAEQPFPSDWFLTSPTSLFSLSSPSSSSSSPTGTCSTTTSTSCTVPTPALHEHLPPSSDSPSPLYTSHEPDIPKRSRKESIYIRKRDVDALYIDYVRHADEERAQDILECSKGVQCAVRTVKQCKPPLPPEPEHEDDSDFCSEECSCWEGADCCAHQDHTNSIQESPRSMKRKLEKANDQLFSVRKQLETSQAKAQRLKKKVDSLQEVLKTLKKKNYLTEQGLEMLEKTYDVPAGTTKRFVKSRRKDVT
eukprot:XP_003725240.1 PREDICTED: uncharacterized protein LOC100891213 [Strongylocentrotus purpuratus]